MSKNTESDYLQSLMKVKEYIEENDFYGYDPYDGLNTDMRGLLTLNNKWLKISLIQFLKLFPFNIRPLLKVKKGRNLKGIGLIASGYLNLFQMYKKMEYLKKAEECLSILKSSSLKDENSYFCWNGTYFEVVFPNAVDLPDNPSIICTVTSALAFLKHHELTGSKESLIIAESSIKYLKDVLLVRDGERTFLKYTPRDDNSKMVYNASAHGVLLFSRYYRLKKDEKILEISKEIMDLIIRKQNDDGSWYYSEVDGEIRKQIDFHQGFMIDGLWGFIYDMDQRDRKYLNSLKKGLDFYRNKQFIDDGRAKWRYPRIWPIDTHNQAQGIITFANLDQIDKELCRFSGRIANWMINEMQDPSGYFYYQKWPVFKTKISYMRWSQAWMFYALSELLVKCKMRD